MKFAMDVLITTEGSTMNSKHALSIFFAFMVSISPLIVLGCSAGHKLGYIFKENLTKNDAQSVSRGHQLFLTNCAECHGPDARGGVSFPIVIPDLVDFAKSSSENDIAYKIATGHVYHMPDFDRILNERDIWDITNYLKSLHE